MDFVEIFGAIIGVISITALIVLCFVWLFFLHDSEKQNNAIKNKMYSEITKYYKYHNDLFDGKYHRKLIDDDGNN